MRVHGFVKLEFYIVVVGIRSVVNYYILSFSCADATESRVDVLFCLFHKGEFEYFLTFFEFMELLLYVIPSHM